MLEREAALSRLEPAQGGDIEVRPLGDLGEGEPAFGPQVAQAAADALVDRVGLRRPGFV